MNQISHNYIRLLNYVFGVMLISGYLSACQASRTLEQDFEASAQPSLRKPIQAKVTIEEAEGLLKQGKLQKARRSFAQILAKEPQFNRAKIGLCETLRLSGNSKQALNIAETIFDDPVYGPEARTISALIEISLNNISHAKELLESSLAMRQDQWRAWNAMGIVYDSNGDWSEADESYKKALGFSPDPSFVLNNYGMSMLKRGDYEGGKKLFERALEQDPNNNQFQNNWRLSLALLGKYRAAAAGLDDRNLPDVLNNIGYVAMIKGDYIQAESYLLQAIEASPTYFTIAYENLRILNTLKAIKK